MSLYPDEKVSFKKTIRILVYPNITFGKDLEKDSYIQVIKKQISLLNTIRDDLWFYLILPKEVPSLAFDNVTQFYVNIPTHPPTMRVHFDTELIKKIVSNDLDFDLVMSHLPEHTVNLKNVLYNTTQHVPLFFGYCHWFDLKNVVTWSANAFKNNVVGILEMNRCYLNTEYQKSLVLEESKEIFNDKTINQLEKILKVQHLGVDKKDITDNINLNPEKIIVFNHRPDTYKYYKEFLKVTDKLYEQRQDFKVWVPLASKPDRDYIIVDKGNKEFYYNFLKKCYIGYSPKQTYGGWSVATTDGMMNGVPYIMYNKDYYKELYDKGNFVENDEELIERLNYFLDNKKERNEYALNCLTQVKENLIFKNEVKAMSDYIDTLVKSTKELGESEALKKIINWIKKEKKITKKEIITSLGWGVGIKWTPYRRALLTNPNIYDSMTKYPTYNWIE
jgi:glycosyltransferase involved in cell wall biosynthesis